MSENSLINKGILASYERVLFMESES